MPKLVWNDERIEQARFCLSNSESVWGAIDELANEFCFCTTHSALRKAFQARGLKSPENYLLGKHVRQVPDSSLVQQQQQPKSHLDLVGLLVKHNHSTTTLEDLCNKLDVSPAKLRQLLKEAGEAGYAIKLGAEHIGIGHADTDDVHELEVPPTTKGRYKIGVLSDLHAGSKYALRPQTRDCVNRMFKAGVRDVLIVGDLLDGCYKHGEFELRYSGVEEQTQDLARMLPCIPGLRYHAITGNHDFTFSEKTGLNVGQYITGAFKDMGREDISFYGDRAATLAVGGTTVRLLHPSGSCSYAISYKLQKFVEAFGSAEKPGILLVGHYHRSCYVYVRGVHTIACPTFQGPGSAFGKSLGLGAQAIGGLMLSWKLTEQKTLRHFRIETLNYFKHEQPKEIA